MLYAPMFAAVQEACQQRAQLSLDDYHTWVVKVGTHQFADELVLSATAKLLNVCTVTVPHTPPLSASPWAVAEHPIKASWPMLGLSDDDVIVLGNDDVHYVWLGKVITAAENSSVSGRRVRLTKKTAGKTKAD